MSEAIGPTGTWRRAPLSGVRVLEVSHTIAGAHAGKLLRELGAEVYVVDRSGRACGSCDVPEPVAAQLDADKQMAQHSGDSRYDIVVTDEDCCLRAPEGTRVPLDLGRVRVRIQHASTSDSPTMGVSSLGATAVSGVATAIGYPDREPLGLPAGVAETVVGTNAVAAVLAAWLRRDQTNTPIDVAVSTSDCLEFFVGMNSKMYEGYPREWTRAGRRASGSAGPYPAAIFHCKDGFVGLIARSRADWRGLVTAMGEPAWAQSDEMQDPWHISQHLADDVDPLLQAWVAGLTEAELVELSLQHGFVVAPIRTVAEVVEAQQLLSRGFWRGGGEGEGALHAGVPFLVTEPPTEAVSVNSLHWPRPSDRKAIQVEPNRILQGLRVLDLSWVWAGPMVTMVLADLGAEVIKIESRDRPDGSRTRGRPSRNGEPVPGPELEVTPYFHQVGHGKLSFEADLKDPSAREQILRMARDSDVLVENMRPGVMTRLGLSYEDLSAVNPGLVMLSMTLAGQEGPLAQMKGYAPVMGGLSGLEGLLGYGPDDVTGMYTFSFCDPNGATYGLVSLLAALASRQHTGRGSWIDLSQLEAAVMALPVQVGTVQDPSAAGPQANADARYRLQFAVRCAGPDEWVAITAVTEKEVKRLSEVVASVSADGDIRLAVESWALARSRDEVLLALRSADIPVEPVLTWPDVVARRMRSGHPQTLEVHHPFGGLERIHVPPWRFPHSVPGIARRAPLLGEHTEVVSESLGLSTSPDLARSGKSASPSIEQAQGVWKA